MSMSYLWEAEAGIEHLEDFPGHSNRVCGGPQLKKSQEYTEDRITAAQGEQYYQPTSLTFSISIQLPSFCVCANYVFDSHAIHFFELLHWPPDLMPLGYIAPK